MKITLFALNASYVHTCLALRALAAPLRADGHDVTILEFTLKDTRARVLEALYDSAADIYGFSCYIWSITEILPLSAELSALCPDARIILGGPEVSFCAEDILRDNPHVCHVITGEGEDALRQLCRDLELGNAPPSVINGGAYADFEQSGILYTPDELYGGQIFYYESCRGCPFHCAYCLSSVSSYGKKRVRAKSAEKTLADLLEFEVEGASVKIIKLVDRTFNFDRERAKQILRGLCDEKYTKSYHFEICASLLDDETIDILRSAPHGKFQLEIGVQSTNEKTLSASDRTPDTSQVLHYLRRLRSVKGVHVHADLIAGLPCESYESFGRSFDDLFGLCDQLQLGFLKLLKGSPMRARAAEYGYRFSPRPPYEVLANNSISFTELCALKRVAALVERLANSGAFANSLDYIIRQATPSRSPFRFFEAFDRHLGCDVALISGRALYERILGFASSHITQEQEMRELIHRLVLDFLIHETSPLPAELSVRLPSSLRPDLITDSTERKRLLFLLGPDACAASTVFLRVCFLDGVQAIDRRTHQWTSIEA